MKTRTEIINGYVYCTYCGKELKNPNLHVYPEPQLICNCEKAKEELELYDKLRILYNHPLADDLIEKKVEIYRNSLKGNLVSEVSLSTIPTFVDCLPVQGNTTYDVKYPNNFGISVCNCQNGGMK